MPKKILLDLKNLASKPLSHASAMPKEIYTSDEILDLLELATESGAAILMSTHNFPLIQPRKKRFIELNEGRLVNS